jgi:subtilisin family serine protease
MTKFRNSLLISSGLLLLFALFLAGSVQAQETLQSAEDESLYANYSPADEFGRAVYLVEFAEPGLMERFRQVRSHGERFDIQTPRMQSELADLQAQQQMHIQNLATTAGRSLEVTHYYLASHSGIATRLTPAEARAVGNLPGVVRVERERVYELDTYRGPEFIGADSLWNGTGNPGGTNLLGEDMVAAILDTGIVVSHPSFANDAACGHGVGGADDKLLSALDCETTDGTGLCNGPDPSDGHSHGSHVAGTVAGNFLDSSSASPAPPVAISGVAPCARVRAYKVCPTSCPGAQIQAGMDSVLLHGDVDVMNFSISGGRSPWADNDRKKLDLVDAGIFVAASAGNTSTSIPDPLGQVGHLGPWVATVANSSHDGLLAHTITVAGTLGPIAGLPGTGPALTTDFSGQIRWAGDVDPANIEGCAAFAAGSFTGEAALISRGSCSFAIKVDNAAAAGADYVIVYNNAAGAPIVMGALDGTTIASSMVSLDDGNAIIAELDGSPASVLVEAQLSAYLIPALGDILSGGSLIGPTPSPVQNLQKPDITGPGTSIFAPGTGSSGYTLMSGTSMSSPHLAGAAVLMHQAHPDWSPVEVKSAIMMTASKTGSKPANSGPWDADDVGSGRADLSVAAQAGLVMHETFANFLAANPATGGDVRTLNLAALRDMDCSPQCSFTRTVRNTLDDPTSWSVAVDGLDGVFAADVQPATFAFTGDTSETQTLTFTFTPNGDQSASISFGEVQFTEDTAQSPDLHYTVALSGQEELPPEAEIGPNSFNFLLEEDDSNASTLTIANIGEADLLYTIDQAEPAAVVLDLANQSSVAPRDGQTELIGLVLDGFDGGISGVGVGGNSFLWFNRFTPGPLDLPFTLEEVDVLWPTGFFNNQEGDVFDLYVWTSPDGDPTSGNAVFESSVTGLTLPAAAAFDTIVLPGGGVDITADSGDIFIGLVNRTPRPSTSQAIGDSGIPSQGRSWIAFNFSGGVGDPPQIHEAGSLAVIDDFGLPRNWIIRGFGTGGSACLNPSNVPWLTVTPDAGTIAGGDFDEITVTVDMNGLGTGLFEARLCIETNDENLPVMVIPIEVQVVAAGGLPTIDVDPVTLSYNVDVLNTTDSQNLDIENLGNDLDLEWFIEEAMPLSMRGGGPSLSVDGMETHGSLGNPANSSMTLEIGVGNQVTGIGYEVTIETFGGSWLSESRLAILSNSGDSLGSGAEIIPGQGDNAGGVQTYSSGGIVALGTPVDANGAGEIYLEWFESFVDDEFPDSIWSDPASGAVLPPGLTLQCTNQALCDAALVIPDACDLPSDVSWLSVSPASGTTAALGISPVSVDVDASGLEPGTYDAILCIHSNDPATPLVEVPVSLDVVVPANAALIEGTVQGLGYCQANPGPAAGAAIEIVGSLDTFNLTADANGFYSLYLDDANSPVDVTASATGHISDSETGVALAGQTTTVVDFDLLLDSACATVTPADMYFEMGADDSDSALMTIGNVDGSDSLTFAIQEAEINEVEYLYGLEGAGVLLAGEGFDRSSDRAATPRDKQQSPIVEAGIQGGPISEDWAEGFDDITLLPGAGWFLQNNSEPLGTIDWFQGNPASFEAHEGAPESYIAANFNNTTGGTGTISNWLLTPEITLNNGTELRFWTRVPTGSSWADRLEVRLSTSGASTDVGTAATDVGVFDTLLVSVNEGLTVGGYPDVWTEFVIEVEGLDEPTSGRFAFRYFVTSAGPSGANSNYIGIDTVSVTQPAAIIACENPSNVPWLDATPFFGSVAAGDSTDVTVSASSAGLEPGLYEAALCVNTDDPEAALFAVPVSMFVLAPEALAFDDQPVNTEVGETLASVTVVVLDGFGEVDVDDNSTVVELSLETNPTGANLSGQTSVTVVNGVAEFTDLSIDAAGQGYRFEAVDQGGTLVAALSDEFDILQAASTTTIIEFDPATQMVGMPYTVTVGVTGYNPTGMVTVSDDQGATCQIDVETEDSCDLTSLVAGTRTISADYAGDGNNMVSSDSDSYTVEQAVSTTTITMIDPADEQFVNQPYTVTVDVTGFNPTGMVMVDDGTGGSCQFDLEIDDSCELTSTTLGEKTITAQYQGDNNNAGSSDTDNYLILFSDDVLFWDRFEAASSQ